MIVVLDSPLDENVMLDDVESVKCLLRAHNSNSYYWRHLQSES